MQKLLMVGLAVIVAGVILLVIGGAGQGSGSFGGVVFIGPLPIVFGTGQNGTLLALVSLVIGAFMVGLSLLWLRGARLPGS